MKKFLLMLAMMLPCLGAWAQTPVLTLSEEVIGTTYPCALNDEDASKILALDNLTIAVQINTTSSVSGRMALLATSDPTQAKNSGAEGKSSRYVAYGMNGADAGYLASWNGNDRFTGKKNEGITANKNNMLVVYVINPANKIFRAYLNGVEQYSKVNAHPDGFMSGYEIATPKMVKNAHTDAKIYIGGGKHSGGNGEVFNGTITNIRVYDGALTANEIAALKPIYNLETEIASLDEAITNAQTLFDKIKNHIGSGLGKYSSTNPNYATDFENIINFRENIGENTTPEEVIAKVTEVENIIASFSINQPTGGKFYRLKNSASGWYATSILRTNETEHSNKLYMKEAGNTAESIWYLTEDNKFVSYKEGRYLAGFNGSNDDWSFEAIGTNGNVVTFNESDIVGKYQISPSSGRALYGDNVRVDAAGDVNKSGNYAWTIEEVTWLPIPVNVEAGYTTIYSPVELDLSFNRFKAYTVSETSATYAKLEEQAVVPAGVGVVLELQQGAEVENGCVFLQVKATETTNVTSVLLGTYADEYITTDAYVLGLLDSEVGFYTATKNFNNANEKVEEGGVKWLNNGFKAYLPKTTTNKVLRFNFGGTTGIEDAIVAPSFDANAPIYDLSGRRVVNAVKGGLYIQNGKKFIVK